MIIVTDFAYYQHSICILNSGGISYCDISNAISTGTITANATNERFVKYKNTNFIPYSIVHNKFKNAALVDTCGVAIKKAEQIFLNYCIDLRKDRPVIDFYAVCINRAKFKEPISGKVYYNGANKFEVDIYASSLKKPFISILLRTSTSTPIGEIKIDDDNPFVIKDGRTHVKEANGVYLNPGLGGNCFSVQLDVGDWRDNKYGFKVVTFNTKSNVALLYTGYYTNVIHYVKDTKNNRFLIDNLDPNDFYYGTPYYNSIRARIKRIFFYGEEKPTYFVSNNTLKDFIIPPNLFHYIQKFTDKKGIFLCTYIVMMEKENNNIKDSQLNNTNNCSNLSDLFIRGDYIPVYRKWEKLKKELESFINYDIDNNIDLYTEKITCGPDGEYKSIVLSVLMDYTGNFCIFKNNIESLPRTNSYPFLEEIDGVFYIKPIYYYKKVIL